MGEVVSLFLRLGVTAFGGPAAHIAMMHDEVVRRRGWVSNERFVDLLGATNLVPGPNSTELAIHLGWERARWRGLVLAGVCFILPAALMVGFLAWLYVERGDTPAFEGVLYGVRPVVIALILQALVKLFPAAVGRDWLRLGIAAAALAAALLGVHELAVMAAGGLLGLLASGPWRTSGSMVLPLGLMTPVLAAVDVTLLRLFWVLLRIGAVLYGSGYVLLSFLEGEVVQRLGWLTTSQLADAISIGQVTPGPLFTTATFVGYVVAGFWGAVVATVAIFLPAFVFVALLTRIVGWMRSQPLLAAALDGINAAALALVAAVAWHLGRAALIDPLTVVLAAATLVVLWRTKLNSAWLVGAGALVGVVHELVL